MSRKQNKQSGQATLEYVLLMFIVLALGTGALMKFSKSFKNYGDALVGGQLECALKYGQFPDSLPAGICELPKFDPNGTLTNSNGAGGNSAEGKTASAGENGKNKSSDSDSGGNGSGGGGGGRGGADGNHSSNGGRRFAANGGDSSDGKEGSDDSGISRGNRNITVVNETVRVGNGDKSRYIPVTGTEDKSETEKKQTLSVKSDGESVKQSKKIPVNMEDRKPTAVEPDEPFTLGSFLKYIIIGAIIIALLVFFGNQIMSFQKSKD